MTSNTYIPDRGDIVLLQFDPQAGREQSGKRPSVILTPKEYNKRAGLALVCPITSKQKGYPFEVELSAMCKTEGVVLVDHIKSMDFRTRNATYLESLPKETLESILSKAQLLLQ